MYAARWLWHTRITWSYVYGPKLKIPRDLCNSSYAYGGFHTRMVRDLTKWGFLEFPCAYGMGHTRMGRRNKIWFFFVFVFVLPFRIFPFLLDSATDYSRIMTSNNLNHTIENKTSFTLLGYPPKKNFLPFIAPRMISLWCYEPHLFYQATLTSLVVRFQPLSDDLEGVSIGMYHTPNYTLFLFLSYPIFIHPNHIMHDQCIWSCNHKHDHIVVCILTLGFPFFLLFN